jgi:L-fuculose-phosphate aldolase
VTEDLVAACHQVAETGLVLGGSGNLSIRVGDEVLITRQGARLATVAAADLSRIALATGDLLEGPRPSSESQLHRDVYLSSDAQAVVHTHPHFATVLSTTVTELPAIHYGITAFGGPVRVAPYRTFGTPELAAVVNEALIDRTGALMANHGAVVIGPSIGRAVELAVLLEWLASVYFHARLLGPPATLDAEQLEQVVAQSRRLNYSA